MEAGGKDSEEETLQTAFKKLRVDAESLPGAVSVSEPSRGALRACLESSGAKTKLVCPKDNWHGCMRKTSRGASRSQRRRRSKSPILHPPKFTYCSTASAAALSPPGSCLKHQRLAVPEPLEPHPTVDALTSSSSASPQGQKELSSPSTPGHISPLIFGSCAGYETHIGSVVSSPPSLQEASTIITLSRQDGRSSNEDISSVKSTRDEAESRSGAPQRAAEAADFRALSELHGSGGSAEEGTHISCTCTQRGGSESQEGSRQVAEPRCCCRSHHQAWHGVEVYSFTGLRDVISECEKNLPSHEDASRTLSRNPAAASSPLSSSSPPAALSSGSPRSCSEQARAYVDDITIEDLSGYMEYYLYIPKKMSHMAEMMYT